MTAFFLKHLSGQSLAILASETVIYRSLESYLNSKLGCDFTAIEIGLGKANDLVFP